MLKSSDDVFHIFFGLVFVKSFQWRTHHTHFIPLWCTVCLLKVLKMSPILEQTNHIDADFSMKNPIKLQSIFFFVSVYLKKFHQFKDSVWPTEGNILLLWKQTIKARTCLRHAACVMWCLMIICLIFRYSNHFHFGKHKIVYFFLLLKQLLRVLCAIKRSFVVLQVKYLIFIGFANCGHIFLVKYNFTHSSANNFG